jgi:hypothetical protein
MDFTEIAEEAWERAGREMRSGYDLRTARRSMNLMTIEWQNRGINLWTIDEGTVSLTQGTATYNLPADTIDLLEQVIRTGAGTTQQDLTITRISVSTYATIPNKTDTGRPIQVFTFVYWRLRRIEDAGSGAQTADMNFRFLPCLVAGLAYHIAMKVPELAPRIDMLKAEYEAQFVLAAGEDREKTPFRFVPSAMRQ